MGTEREIKTVDVIIPTYRPGDKLEELLRRLLKQSCPLQRVIILNTEEQYWNEERFESLFDGSKTKLTVRHLTREEFDHGATRDLGMLVSDAEICICMTHDCIPRDRDLIIYLTAPFAESSEVAVSYARQLPAADCGLIERYTRQFNYPQESLLKGQQDLKTLGIKTYFCSNVCAAYKRELYFELGGFTKKTIFNEDMIFAAAAVKAGYLIAYAADAKVIHSHNYTALQQLRRNFDLAVSQADHPEVFDGLSSEGEGIRLVKKTANYLWQSGHGLLLPELVLKSGFKYLGYLLGRHYRLLPLCMVRWMTMNRAYWK